MNVGRWWNADLRFKVVAASLKKRRRGHMRFVTPPSLSLLTFAGFVLIGVGSHKVVIWVCVGFALGSVVYMAAKKRRDTDV